MILRFLYRLLGLMPPVVYDDDAQHLCRAGFAAPIEHERLGVPNWMARHLQKHGKTL